jgi:hypothetical protein
MTYEKALKKARGLTFEEKRALLVTAGWGNNGDWDNWFRPGDGWNFSTTYAVTNHFQYPPKTNGNR